MHTTNFIRLKDSTIYTATLGKGKVTLVFLGWLSNLDKFPYHKIYEGENKKYLQHNKLIFVHPSNLYKSSVSNKPYTINDYTNEIKQLVDRLKLKKFNLIGHSAGGRYVVDFAATHPNMVNKIILANSAGATARRPTKKQLAHINYFFNKYDTTKKEYQILKQTFINLYTANLKPQLTKITKPTLIIWGQNDTTIRPSRAKVFNEKIKNSKVIIYKNIDHMTTYQPKVWKDIFKFIN